MCFFRKILLIGLFISPVPGNLPLSAQSGSREKVADGAALSPGDSIHSLIPAEGLAVDLVASEPGIRQPSFLRLDEKGRLWVIQYLQYPVPAGLEIVNRDNFWRNTYDKVPAPPGHPDYIPGADRITILEDKDGDGHFESRKDFLDNLNMATGLAWDRDGVWVLQPPYLLFYYDRNHDDVPDGKPEVHLRGFGLEDSHSIANSLTWGPDGWLYGAQGSTVTASITVESRKDPPVKSIGQLMWRYHPTRHLYEIVSEGGGNIWSCQFDSKGRLLAGANEGQKLGYHYMQGAYNKKNFPKHGALSNPHAFGYFQGIEEPGSQRVTTNLTIYGETALPHRYAETIITANPLIGRVLASRPVSRGPSFHSEPVDVMVDSRDRWFRPVYAETGPDGSVYVADWYDRQISHIENNQGRLSPKDGRIYRIRADGDYRPFHSDLGKLPVKEIAHYLKDPRKWYRDTARRLLHQRQDKEVIPVLGKWLQEPHGQTALESLWALNLLNAFGPEEKRIALNHSDPFVRKWAVRLIGDARRAEAWEYEKMRQMAVGDPQVEVRQQLASSAKRLQTQGGLNIVRELLMRDEDAGDPYMPLLVWWALESFCSTDVQGVISLFENRRLFDSHLVQDPLLGFLMRRLASENSRAYLRACARFLNLAPDPASRQALLAGFEEAYRGRSMTGLPPELLEAISQAGGGSLAMRVRQKIPDAISRAKSALAGNRIDNLDRIRIIEALGEVLQPGLPEVLLAQLNNPDEAVQVAALSALRNYNEPRVGDAVVSRYPEFTATVRSAAQTLLSSRPSWAITWLTDITRGKISPESVSRDVIPVLEQLNDRKVFQIMEKIWPDAQESGEDSSGEFARLRDLLEGNTQGDRYTGRDLYLARCAACHRLHGEGGNIGPDLTGYQRMDLESLLRAILTPNTEIREGFENVVVKTTDGQVLAGFIVDRDQHVLVLRPAGGREIVLKLETVASLDSAGVSLMPENLLAGMDDQAILDLFSYLQAPQPLNVRRR